MGWIIFADILLVIAVALMLSVRVDIRVISDEFFVKVKYAGITVFSISPQQEQNQKKEKKKKKKKSSEDKDKFQNAEDFPQHKTSSDASDTKSAEEGVIGQTNLDNSGNKADEPKKEKAHGEPSVFEKLGVGNSPSDIMSFIIALINSAAKPIKSLIKSIRVNNLMLYIIASGEDAAQAALNYGKTNWMIHTALAFLYKAVKLDVKETDITVDFTSGKTEFYISCNVKLRVINALVCAVWLFIRLIRLYMSIQKQNNSGNAGVQKA